MYTNLNKSRETTKFDGHWAEQSRQLKAKFSQKTNSDTKFESGNGNGVDDNLGTKLSKSSDDVTKFTTE